MGRLHVVLLVFQCNDVQALLDDYFILSEVLIDPHPYDPTVPAVPAVPQADPKVPAVPAVPAQLSNASILGFSYSFGVAISLRDMSYGWGLF
jgi:hypothetical protein